MKCNHFDKEDNCLLKYTGKKQNNKYLYVCDKCKVEILLIDIQTWEKQEVEKEKLEIENFKKIFKPKKKPKQINRNKLKVLK